MGPPDNGAVGGVPRRGAATARTRVAPPNDLGGRRSGRASDRGEPSSDRGRGRGTSGWATALHRRRRRLFIAAGILAVVLLGAGYQGARAARAGLQGKAALLRAETLLSEGKFDEAAAALAVAKSDFTRSRREARRLERFIPFGRVVPVLGPQLRGVVELAESGVLLSEAGVRLAAAASAILRPEDDQLEFSSAVAQLRGVQELVREGVTTIDAAVARVDSLDGQPLLRPLGNARADLARRLPEIRTRAVHAADALSSLVTFAGADGPRRYLVLSQNPDELRPTGGYIGTYGVLTAEGGELALETYDAVEKWYATRPEAVATPEETGSPLRWDRRLKQNLANVNTSPDWPQAAQLATRLWERGGEDPVQGVVSFTPAFLARILQVLGPVPVESFNETVTAGNLIERLDYHTHLAPELTADRKEFIADLAKEIMPRLFDARASQWEQLARVIGEAFAAREAMVWSTDADVARVLSERRWDGSVPERDGDFVLPAEFEYSNKNGRELRRTYDHRVTVATDGSAEITTHLTLTNPDPVSRQNLADSLTYITMYGPTGAIFDSGSDPLGIVEPEVAGHPGVGWFRVMAPQSQVAVTVVWRVPKLLEATGDGRWTYSLLWMRHPDHTGDTLRLAVELPRGWRWEGPAPPPEVSLDQDVVGTWAVSGG